MISEIYADLLIRSLLQKKYIATGQSPTGPQFDALRASVAVLDLTKSRVKFTQEYKTESSAVKINDAIDTFTTEIKTIKSAANYLRNYNKRITDLALNYMTLISRDALNNVLNVCTSELAKISGLNYNLWDGLTDLSKINQQATTALVNIEDRSVTLKLRPTSQRVDLQYLDNDNFRLIVTNGSYIGLNLVAGSEFKFAIADDENIWRHNLVADTSGSKSIALEIDLEKEVNITHAILGPLEADREDGVGIRVLGSTDGTSWSEAAPSALYKALKADIKLTPSTIRYLRLEMTKVKPSFQRINGTEILYIYEFGLSYLQLFATTYYNSAIFESNILYFKDYNNSSVPINKIRVDVSDQRPLGTDISYYIGNSIDDGTISITPGTVVDLGNLTSVETIASAAKRLDNFHALIDADLNTNYKIESLKLFRNVYQPDVIINGLQSGWTYSNGYYSCIFELDTELEIDLGINPAFINNRRRVGVNVLAPGIYKFRTLENNWRSVQSEALDPLFPYNHKLLIEGITGSKIYKGAKFLAANELQLISIYNLMNNIGNNDDRFFAVRGDSLVVKIPSIPFATSDIEGWRQEVFAVRYKYHTDASVTGIKLIAKLNSNSIYKTPVFRGYTIVAGY